MAIEARDLAEIWVEPSPALNGALRFQTPDPAFGEEARARELLDGYDTLIRQDLLPDLEALAAELGIEFRLVGEAGDRLEALRRAVIEPFDCGSPWLKGHQLRPFQHVGMNIAAAATSTLLEWPTGGGKTVGAALVAQRLFQVGAIDGAVFLVRRSKKAEWAQFIAEATTMRPGLAQGTPAKRRKAYDPEFVDAVVVNHDLVRLPPAKRGLDWKGTDLGAISDFVWGRRILFVIDEIHRVSNPDTQAAKGIRALRGGCEEVRTIGLTATAYRTDPGNYRGIWEALEPGFLPGEDEFHAEYVQRWRFTTYGKFPVWDAKKFALLGRRMSTRTHGIAKEDPRIASQFPALFEPDPIPIEISKEDRRLYDAVMGRARDEWAGNSQVANEANFTLARATLCTAEAVAISAELRRQTASAPKAQRRGSKLALAIVESGKFKLESKTSAKFERAADYIEAVLEQGDPIVVFTAWPNLVGEPFARYLEHRGICFRDGVTPSQDEPYKEARARRGSMTPVTDGGLGTHRALWVYTGSQTDSRNEQVLKAFLETNGVYDRSTALNSPTQPSVLLASDAAQDGLNVYAPYVLQLDTPTTWSAYSQRRDRISRLDSKDRGIETITAVRLQTLGTLEERVESTMLRRRGEGDAIHGAAAATASRAGELRKLMFG